jgi:hypothetical protein
VIEWRKTDPKSREIANYKIKKSPRSISLKEKAALASRAANGAKAELPNARQVSAVVLDSLRKILIVNSDGLVSRDEKTYLQIAVEVVGEVQDQGESRVESAYETDGGFVGIEFFDRVTPESIGAEAAKRVKVLLTAVPAPSGSMPVVLASEAGGYARIFGDEVLKKMIFRRLTTMPGSYFHIPEGEFGQNLKVKEPLRGSSLPALKAAIETEIRREPGVVDVRTNLSLSNGNLSIRAIVQTNSGTMEAELLASR